MQANIWYNSYPEQKKEKESPANLKKYLKSPQLIMKLTNLSKFIGITK